MNMITAKRLAIVALIALALGAGIGVVTSPAVVEASGHVGSGPIGPGPGI
jgi:hypothetical protein